MELFLFDFSTVWNSILLLSTPKARDITLPCYLCEKNWIHAFSKWKSNCSRWGQNMKLAHWLCTDNCYGTCTSTRRVFTIIRLIHFFLSSYTQLTKMEIKTQRAKGKKKVQWFTTSFQISSYISDLLNKLKRLTKKKKILLLPCMIFYFSFFVFTYASADFLSLILSWGLLKQTEKYQKNEFYFIDFIQIYLFILLS